MSNMKTTVANVYSKVPGIYIGRKGKGQDGYFGNPFRAKDESQREEVIALYRKYFYKRIAEDDEFYNRIVALSGSVLLCFCAPKKCHGNVIANYLNQE